MNALIHCINYICSDIVSSLGIVYSRNSQICISIWKKNYFNLEPLRTFSVLKCLLSWGKENDHMFSNCFEFIEIDGNQLTWLSCLLYIIYFNIL